MGRKRTRDEEAERKYREEHERAEQSRQASDTESESLRAVIMMWDTTIARLQRSVSDAQRERDEALDRADDKTKSAISLKIEPQRLDDTSEPQPRKLRAPEDDVRSVSGEKDMAESRVTETERHTEEFQAAVSQLQTQREETQHTAAENALRWTTRERGLDAVKTPTLSARDEAVARSDALGARNASIALEVDRLGTAVQLLQTKLHESQLRFETEEARLTRALAEQNDNVSQHEQRAKDADLRVLAITEENTTLHHVVQEQQTLLSETEQQLKEAFEKTDVRTEEVQLVLEQQAVAEKAVLNDPLAEREKELLSGEIVFIKKEPLSLDDELERRSVFNSLACATKITLHAELRLFLTDHWYAERGNKPIPSKGRTESWG